ncbi:MAG: ATP-binding protein [Spirochaetaceae bacterium]|nr:ATP-binding protein [Spirochaetaceae bacterium]
MDKNESFECANIQYMLDSSPFAAHFWDENLHIIDCNQAAVKMFNLSSKQEYIDRYFELTPEFQPDGVRSIDKIKYFINETYKSGYQKVEWMRRSVKGEPIPVEITLVRVEYQGKKLIAGYISDLREYRRMTDDIEKRDTLLDIINRTAELLLAAANDDNFEASLVEGMELIGKYMDADFVQIWPNEMHNGVLHFALKYKWLSEIGKKAPPVDIGTAVPYSDRWKELFFRGEYVNGPLSALPKEDQDLLKPLGISSTVTVPLFYQDEFWGVFCVDDCIKERFFTEGEINLLYSAGLMMVNAINRNLQAAETKLQLAKLNLVVKAAKIGLWDMEVIKDDPVNPKNAFMWSDEFRNMLEFTDEIDFPNILSSWSDRLHPDDKQRTLNSFARHLMDTTGKTPYDVEYRLRKKGGEYGFYRASGITIRDEEGNAIRVAGTLLDITEIKNLLLNLEKESAIFQTMFDSIPDLIFCKDTNSKYTRCNESLLQYFNLKEEDLIGKDDVSGLGIPENIAEDYKAMDRVVMDEIKIMTYEEYVPDPDGNMRLFETNKVPLLLNNKITGIMGIAREITERKAMEDAAQSANKAKSTFLANMSHEIRTPMNAIIGMSEILEHEDLNSRQMGFVKDISNSAISLLSIINDILDMSKIEAGKLELHPVDYNFNQFMDNIISMFTHVANKKGLEFLFETDKEIPDYLFGDDIRLRQVITNICGNAVKFTEKGHVKLSVKINGDKLIFKIEDTGAGIKKEDLPKLFRAFEQVDKTKNRFVMGTGLGLPICKSFVEMMDGEIGVESEYGFGSAFTVTIPIIKGNPENIQKVETNDKAQAIFAPEARILVTDDNEFNLKVACGLLNLMDIEAETADSGDKSIELIKKNDYDIVFMDHMMPEKDGIETVQEIRKLGGKYEKLIIIALTANAVSGAREMFLENNFNDFISKPIDANELNEIVKKHLPVNKICTESKSKGEKAQLDKQDELFSKAIITFVKENRVTMKKITDSLNSGDTKTAHRIAHTLKSSAGFLGKKALQEAAFSLEQSLHGDPAKYTPEQLAVIDKELEKALHEYEPLLKAAESEKPKAVQICAEELAVLFVKLRPLLEKGDFSAVSYVEKLQGIAGMEELAERIDDYDFENALKVLNTLE